MPTVSVPSGAMTRLEREEIGAASSAPSCMTIPVGGPFPAKKSPLTPTTVASELWSFSIPVSGSVPRSAPWASAGPSVYSEPSGFGAVTTSRTTGPREVNCTWRWYVTPGMSSFVVDVWAPAGAASTPAAKARMSSLRSTDPAAA